MRMTRLIFLVWLTLISMNNSTDVFADNSNQLRIGQSSISSLLNQKTITNVKLDKSGFLWIGTQQGLHKYDGNMVSTFSSRDRAKFWLSNLDIRQIEVGENGDIWVATFGGGIAKYDWRKQSFVPLYSERVADYMYVTSLLDTNDGNIWFGTRDAGMGMYRVNEKKHANWLKTHPLNSQISQPSDIIQHSSGDIWVGSSPGLYLIEPELQEITAYTPPLEIKLRSSTVAIKAIELASNDSLWVGTESGKLLLFDLKTRKFNLDDSFSGNSLGSIKDISIHNNQIWTATDQGLIAIEMESGDVTKFTKKNSSLSNDHVTTLFHDGNVLWVGTYFGLNLVSKSSFETFNLANSGVANEILSFSTDLADRLWIGTYDGVFYREKNSKVHHPVQALSPEITIADQRIMSIAAKAQEIWLGFRHSGIQIVDLANQTTYKQYFPENSNLAITKILHTSNGDTWVGTYHNGLYRLRGGKVDPLYREASEDYTGLNQQSITALYETKSGGLLIGTEGGAYAFDPITKYFSPLKLEYEDKSINPTILSIAQSDNGDIWIGTKDHGIFLRSKSKGQKYSNIALISPQLTGVTVYAIEFDDADHAWISTANGLLEIDQAGRLMNSYSSGDGLQGDDFNFGASHKDSKGRLYFGGSNGYNRFDPEHIEAELISDLDRLAELVQTLA